MSDFRKPDPSQTKPDASTELNVYADVYKVLLGGMLLSTLLFVIAIVRALTIREFIPLTPDWARHYYHWSAIAAGIRSFDPIVIMLIATVLLILTPVVRIIVSIYAFMVDRDHKYVVITSIVLLVMIITVILGTLGLQ